MKLAIVLNTISGTLRGRNPPLVAADLTAIFRARGHDASCELQAGPDAAAAIARHCRSGRVDAVVAGGGDGTLSAAASAAAAHGIPLGVLPLGTMNLFARSLGMPLTLHAAAEAIAVATPRNVDIGIVNGRYFVHHVTLGMHPRIIRLRERMRYSSRSGKLWAGLQAGWSVLRRPPTLGVRIALDGEPLERRASAILVSNNRLGEGHLPYADGLEQGRLGLYVNTSERWTDLVELGARMGLGEYSHNPLLESWAARRIDLSFQKGPVKASVDGEIVRLRSPARVSIADGGLLVLAPAGVRQLGSADPVSEYPGQIAASNA